MVEKIAETKNKVLEHLEKAVAEQRMDTQEVGDLADVVKDLAMAEKECWEAEYYKAVTNSMKMGYDGMGYENGMGYDGQQGYQGGQYGYRGRDSMGRYTSRRGYEPDHRMPM